MEFRSGFVAIVGRPNVGKSALTNMLMGQKIAAVSARPQMTRRRQLGILSVDDAQIVFIDTPGLHQPHHRLGEYMNREAQEALQDVDAILWVVDCSQAPNDEDRLVAERLSRLQSLPPTLLVLNKVDQLSSSEQEARKNEYHQLLPQSIPLYTSATLSYHLPELLQTVITYMPLGQPFYDLDQVTDLYEREIAIDLIREAALLHLRDEVPHAIAVRVDEYAERSETQAYIAATLFVERDSHKGIVIGKGGEMLKRIGSTARQEIERMSGRKIYLELRVKVNKNWRDDPDALRLLGYFREDE